MMGKRVVFLYKLVLNFHLEILYFSIGFGKKTTIIRNTEGLYEFYAGDQNEDPYGLKCRQLKPYLNLTRVDFCQNKSETFNV